MSPEPTNNPSPETPASSAEILTCNDWIGALAKDLRAEVALMMAPAPNVNMGDAMTAMVLAKLAEIIERRLESAPIEKLSD